MQDTLDTARLDPYLRARIPGLAGAPRVEPISGGQSNPTFFITYDNRRLVLRKQPAGELLPSAHAVDREFRVISALNETSVPVPRALLFCDDRAITGTLFYVMERLEGRVFAQGSLPDIPPSDRRAMYLSMADTLAALHAVDPATIGLSDFGRASGYFARQVARWTKQWQLSRTRDDENIDRLIAWLPTHIPDDDRAAISHGDYRIGNLMFHPTEPRVIAILDWELSTIGHPLADLAHSCMAWQTAPEEYGGLQGLDLAKLGLPTQAEYESRYYTAAANGLRMQPFHMALALFRWAIIFEGIAQRAKSGTAASDNAAEVGRLSQIFAAKAAEFT